MESALKRLKKDERVSLGLREAYEKFGYKKYKMSKFEEYSLYLDNKNFLKCQQVITFNSLDGRLMALKPDITLSIAKNTNTAKGQVEKLYYIENVYRLAKHTKEYKETGQLGLEAMGDIDSYTTLEVAYLALKSLEAIDASFVLDVSHVGYITGLLERLTVDSDVKQKLLDCIVTKNLHDLKREGTKAGVDKAKLESLERIVTLNGDFATSLSVAREIAENKAMFDAVAELESFYQSVKNTQYEEKLRLDFSIINDTSYYNGIIFQGYVERIPTAVLSGGRYDLLMNRFGKDAGAIGFALNLDELSRYYPNEIDADVDIVLLYNDGVNATELFLAVQKLNDEGFRVRVEKTLPDNVKYKRIMKFENGLAVEVKDV
ncbi:MAG TPA: ATP phosphoribosyltransferase regulatory subunit [Clostridia bacterium]|nr:ATP phosphoribosyltransferase regulatory subunit [Clostridia bacterium]